MKLCMVATNSFSLKLCNTAIHSCKHEVHEANQCCNIELYLIKSCNVFLQLYLIKSCNIFLAVPCKFYLLILWHLTTECFCQKVFHTINTLFLLFFSISPSLQKLQPALVAIIAVETACVWRRTWFVMEMKIVKMAQMRRIAVSWHENY